jgi:uncharacterized membrane protein YbhN (UPF0104 family)
MIKSAHEHHSHMFRPRRRTIIEFAILLIAAVVLLPQLKSFGASWEYLTASSIYWNIAAVFFMLLTIVFATLVFVALVPGKLPIRRTWLIQMATYFTNRLLPSGLGGIGFNALYLVKQAKLSKTDAAVYAGTNNLIGVVAFTICISLSTLVSGSQISASLPIKKIAIGVFVLAVVIGITSLAVKGVQKKIFEFVGHLFGMALTMARHPKRVLLAVLFSIGITISYAAVLWATTRSVGVHLSIIDIFIAFVAGNTALTISPTPGGIGAVEAAITAVIVSSGVPSPLALASVVLFRLVSYWLPIAPGFVAYKIATKRGYV